MNSGPRLGATTHPHPNTHPFSVIVQIVRQATFVPPRDRVISDWIGGVRQRLQKGGGTPSLPAVGMEGPGPYARPLLRVPKTDLRKYLEANGPPGALTVVQVYAH